MRFKFMKKYKRIGKLKLFIIGTVFIVSVHIHTVPIVTATEQVKSVETTSSTEESKPNDSIPNETKESTFTTEESKAPTTTPVPTVTVEPTNTPTPSVTPTATLTPTPPTDSSTSTDTKKGSVTGNGVNVRQGPTTSYTSIYKLNEGHQVIILDQDPETSWYKIQFEGNGTTYVGWISSTYIMLEIDASTDPEFEAYLNEQGFPESYRPFLRALHAQHPNWVFEALHTGLNWDTVIQKELTPVYRNLVSKNNPDSWKSLEPGAYDWDKGTWTEYEKGWVAVSSEILQYFLDPRNFLISSGEILQFQSLSWSDKETKDGINKILKGTFMEKSDLDYAQYFLNAGKTHNVSAYHLASRVVQEVCTANGGYSGSVAGPHYNFYNIGATGNNPVAAAVEYAKNKGWDTQEKAIIEGAEFITNGYIRTQQDTLYLQKFDVVDGGNGYYWHQYMSNIQAPTAEAKKLKKTYSDFDNTYLILKVPVYLNMPATPCIKPSLTGSPNYLLSTLEVNNYSLTPFFNKFNTTYDLIVPEDVTSININAAPILSSTKVEGTGKRDLEPGQNKLQITCTAENGTKLVYTINVSRGTFDYSSSTDYNIDKFISGVSIGTSASEFIKNMKVENATVTVLKSDGTVNTGNVGTGNIVQIKQGNKLLNEYQVVIFGDTNGDGNISIIDLANIQKHLLKVKEITGIYAEAGNTDRSQNGINIVDLANIQKHLLKIKSISQ